MELSRERGIMTQITVYEASDRAGGCVRTVRSGAELFELGADSIVIDKPAARRLIDRLGIAERIIKMQQRGAYVALQGRLHRIPPDFRLFMPRSIPALVGSRLFSPGGLLRAACEAFVPRRRSQDDESLASFVRRRLGREVLERLAQPLVGGIYSADPEQLSMQMALPQFLQYEREHRSLLIAMRGAAVKRPELVSFRDGTGTLVDALLQRIGTMVKTNAHVDAVEKKQDAWRIRVRDAQPDEADALICALQAPAAARVLASAGARIADELQQIRCNSIAAINLVYGKGAVSLPAGSGFVVPAIERSAITAATFASQKYANRSDDDHVLIRAFAGGALQPEMVSLDDGELIAAAHSALKRYVAISGAPQDACVVRWHAALPQYAVGHQSTVRSLFARASEMGSLALAGCAYGGVGVPDCIASGEAAAESVFGYVVAAKGELH